MRHELVYPGALSSIGGTSDTKPIAKQPLLITVEKLRIEISPSDADDGLPSS